MIRARLVLTLALTAALLAGGCGKGDPQPPAKPAGYTSYDDPTFKFAVRYPSNWKPGFNTGVAAFYSSAEIGDAFHNFTPGELTGAKIEVRAFQGGEAAMKGNSDTLMKSFEDGVVKGPEQVQLAGRPATKYTYAFQVGETDFKAERCYVMEGDVVTYFETAVFGKYDDYKAMFDTAMASFRPGMMTTVKRDSSGKMTGGDLVDPPATEMKDFSNAHFSMKYPANFSNSSGGNGKLSSVKFMAKRPDSYVQVDVDEAKGELNAIVDANKGRLGNASPASVGGQKAMVFSQADAETTGKFYFMVANGKLYRITVYMFTPQKASYLGPFEQMLASFKAK